MGFSLLRSELCLARRTGLGQVGLVMIMAKVYASGIARVHDG